MTDDAERREHLRVHDQVLLDYELLTAAQMRAALRHIVLVDSSELSPAATFRRLEAELQEALTRLSKQQREVARSLDLLNNKINAAIELLPSMGGLWARDADVVPCNVSASGLAFYCHEPLAVGANLRIRMVIPPAYHHVLAYGEIVRATPLDEPVDDLRYEIGVRFVHILDRHREILARRALQRDIEALRVARRRGKR